MTPPLLRLWSYAARYREVFDLTPVFDARHTRYGLAVELLDREVLRADPGAAKLLERSCQDLLHEIERQDSFGNLVRQLLLSSPGHIPSADEAARRLNVSERTLRRRLGAEQASFQQIVDDVRNRMAQDYLRSTNLSTQQIGELLGFTEATNFRRAFVRWNGCSPHRFRHEQPGDTP